MEFCIIGSDGLFTGMSFQTAINIVKDFISKGRSGEDACRELILRSRMYEKEWKMRFRKSKDDISVIILFFHITKHHPTTDAFVEEVDTTFAQSDDEPLVVDSPEEKLTRSHSEVSMTLYLSRQSQRDSTKTSIREMFSRTPDEFYDVYLPPANHEFVSVDNETDV